MYCQHWAHLFWVKNTTNLYVIIFHDTGPYIDWIWRKNEWVIAFDLEIPTNLEFLVLVSSVLYHISQIRAGAFLQCDIIGPTPELSCPVWGFIIWAGKVPAKDKIIRTLQDTMGKERLKKLGLFALVKRRLRGCLMWSSTTKMSELSLSGSCWNSGKWPGIVAWKVQVQVEPGSQDFAQWNHSKPDPVTAVISH